MNGVRILAEELTQKAGSICKVELIKLGHCSGIIGNLICEPHYDGFDFWTVIRYGEMFYRSAIFSSTGDRILDILKDQAVGFGKFVAYEIDRDIRNNNEDQNATGQGCNR